MDTVLRPEREWPRPPRRRRCCRRTSLGLRLPVHLRKQLRQFPKTRISCRPPESPTETQPGSEFSRLGAPLRETHRIHYGAWCSEHSSSQERVICLIRRCYRLTTAVFDTAAAASSEPCVPPCSSRRGGASTRGVATRLLAQSVPAGSYPAARRARITACPSSLDSSNQEHSAARSAVSAMIRRRAFCMRRVLVLGLKIRRRHCDLRLDLPTCCDLPLRHDLPLGGHDSPHLSFNRCTSAASLSISLHGATSPKPWRPSTPG
jgi:hypothetical protein